MSEYLNQSKITLRSFGVLKLTDEHGADVTPRGRKARALILYLLRVPYHVETRRAFASLLWGDRSEEQARQSLRQTLYELRPLMGERLPILVADRFSVRLNRALLSVSEDHEAWPPKILGSDLDGISPAFDKWLQAERQTSGGGRPLTDITELAVAREHATVQFDALPARTHALKRRPLLVLTLLLMLTTLIIIRVEWAAQKRRRVIVVQPLGVARTDAAAGRLSQDLVSDLSRAVLGHDATLRFADAQNIRAGAAAFVIGGRATTIGGDLHVLVTISEGADPAILWSHDYSAPASDFAGIRQQVSTNVAAVLVCALGARGVPDRLSDETTALYLEACNLHSGDQLQAAYLLRQVTQQAPRFAGGWADLAISLALASDDASGGSMAAMRTEAKVAARRALALDPRTGNAFYASAVLLPGLENWVAREQVVNAGLAAQPDNPQLYNLHARDLAEVGRQAESLAAFDNSVRLDPLSPGKAAGLVRVLANAGEINRANEALERMREIWPDSEYTWHARFATAARMGNAHEAKAMLAQAGDHMSAKEIIAWRIFLDARLMSNEQEKSAAIVSLEKQREIGSLTDAQLVNDLVLLGRPQSALKIALSMPRQDENDFWFRDILKPLRADPRFISVAQRQGLLAVWRSTGRWPDFCFDPSISYDCRPVAAMTTSLRNPSN